MHPALKQRIDAAKHFQEQNRPQGVRVTGNPENDAVLKGIYEGHHKEVVADMAGKQGTAPAIRAGRIIREGYPGVFADPKLAAVMGEMDRIEATKEDPRPHMERYQEDANLLQAVAARPEFRDNLALDPPAEFAQFLTSNREEIEIFLQNNPLQDDGPPESLNTEIVQQMKRQREVA